MESSTVYLINNSAIEVPDAPHSVNYNIVNSESRFAPKWLVFPKCIINTNNVSTIIPTVSSIVVTTMDNRTIQLPVTNAELTWNALQKAFADGVKDRSQ